MNDEKLHKAVKLHKSGNLRRAKKMYLEILQEDPDNSDANHNLGTILLRDGQTTQALTVFKSALETKPRIGQYWISYIDTLIKLKLFDNAQVALTQAIQLGANGEQIEKLNQSLLTHKSVTKNTLPKQNPPLHKLKPLIKLFEDGQFKQLIKEVDALLKPYPESSFLFNAKGLACLGANPEQALDYFVQAMAIDPNNISIRFNLGVAQQALGQLKEALLTYKEVVHSKNDYTDAYYNMGNVLKEMRDYEAAISSYDKCLAVDANYIDAHYNKSIALQHLGDTKAAIASLQESLKKKPNDPRALTNLGLLSKTFSTIQDAKQYFHAAIDVDKFYKDAYSHLGDLHVEQNEHRIAVRFYTKAIRIDPKSESAYLNISTSLLALNKPKFAIGYCRKLLKEIPNSIDGHNNLAIAYQSIGETASAIKSLKKVIMFAPDHPEIHNNLATLLKENGNLVAAKELILKAINFKPDFAGAFNNLGNVFREQGQASSAIESYEKAVTLEPNSYSFNVNLAEAFKAYGYYDNALKYLKRCRELVPASSQHLKHIETQILQCYFYLDEEEPFFRQIEKLKNNAMNNAVVGSLCKRADLKYNISSSNPFCNKPLNYVIEKSLFSFCNFNEVFISNSNKVLGNEKISAREQALLVNAKQTSGNLFAIKNTFTQQVTDIIRDQLMSYREQFHDSREGFILEWPARYSLRGWLVSMKSGGAIRPHIHENGWLSGSIYINVPDRTDAESDSGNLVVSEDLKFSTGGQKSIKVETGSICLFPASLLHHTVPFQSSENRIVLAFDMIPDT